MFAALGMISLVHAGSNSGRSERIPLGAKNLTIKQFKNEAAYLGPSDLSTAPTETAFIVEGYVDEWKSKDEFVLRFNQMNRAAKESLNVNVQTLLKRKKKEILLKKGVVLWVYGWILPRKSTMTGKAEDKTTRDFNVVMIEKPDQARIASRIQLIIEEINPPAVRTIVPDWNVRVTVRNANRFPVEEVQGVVVSTIQASKDDRETVAWNQVDVGRVEANSSKSVNLRVTNRSRLAFVPTFEGQILRLVPAGK